MIKIIILIFIVFVLIRLKIKYQRKEINSREAIIALVFWLIVAGASIWPHLTDVVAKIVGVGRGADLLIYLSLLFLFYSFFQIIIKLEKIDKEITEIVLAIALRKIKKDK